MVGTLRPAAERPLRFVAFGGSLVSEWNNPAATSARAVLAELVAAGHEVTFLDQRGNPHLRAMLENRGSRPYTAFASRYAMIQFRTYDLPRGWERTVWFGREIGTADGVLALPGTPAELLPEIAAVASPYVVRFVDESFDIEQTGYRLVRVGSTTGECDVAFGPSLRLRVDTCERDTRPLVVVYDVERWHAALANGTVPADARIVATGDALPPDIEYRPEVDLPDLYATHHTALVLSNDDAGWTRTRLLLPYASGCLRLEDPSATLDLAPFDAAQHAAAIVSATVRAFPRYVPPAVPGRA